MATTNDKRTEAEKRATIGFVVGTDSFLSGKLCSGRSLYAVAVSTSEELQIVERNMEGRSDMKRARFNLNPPRLRGDDHLTIAGRTEASGFFEPGRW